ncbi:hypothetical protein ONZ51_g12104 [Trametes cubensis]|uniref:Uncharacterized protein n=1 Tax=Trametes cubensis TaxID=1111947 RepID=A0AAD7X5P5_9APHY|nr:hypothetical protein ONZ51_g12104 [Trametes cubensis]
MPAAGDLRPFHASIPTPKRRRPRRVGNGLASASASASASAPGIRKRLAHNHLLRAWCVPKLKPTPRTLRHGVLEHWEVEAGFSFWMAFGISSRSRRLVLLISLLELDRLVLHIKSFTTLQWYCTCDMCKTLFRVQFSNARIPPLPVHGTSPAQAKHDSELPALAELRLVRFVASVPWEDESGLRAGLSTSK